MSNYAAHLIISRRNRLHSKFEALQAPATNLFKHIAGTRIRVPLLFPEILIAAFFPVIG